jgi:hypothetical protein
MSAAQKILLDDTLDKALLEQGYVVIPFLLQQEIDELKSFYYQYHPATQNGMYATAHVADIALRIKMNDFIKQKFAQAIKQTFYNCNALGGSYIAKGKGESGVLNPHQDWNIVDEDKFRSFNIWVPLVKLSGENGVICIAPGSHTWQKTYRSANIPFAFGNREQEFWQTMQRLYMNAGEALIYDHRLIHASGPNTTDEIRLACVYGIIPDGAEMFYYHRKDEQTIEVFNSNPEFFLYGNIFEGPKGLKKRGEITLQPRQSTYFSRILDKIWPSG